MMITGTDSWPTCPKCSAKMSPLKSIPAQSRCVNEKCRWIIVTELKGHAGRNTTQGRPHLVGNRSRTGMAKPVGSGRPKVFQDPVNLTIVVERADKEFWQSEAAACNISLGEYIRDNVNNHFSESEGE